jgi:hypothetical protein
MTLAYFLLDQAQHHALPASVLTAFVISIAYAHRPRAKAFIYSLPVPFSCAYLATSLPINATHLTGLLLVVGYNWLVYLLVRARLPIAAAILLAAGAYFGGAVLLRPLAAISLWWIAAAALPAWLLAFAFYRPRPEPGHRSRTPWYVKAPLIFALAIAVYNATTLLAGGVGLFPYAGIFASYESRHSLRTLAGQFTLNALGLLACLLTIHLAEGRIPAPWPLALGWLPVIGWAAIVRHMKIGLVASNGTTE